MKYLKVWRTATEPPFTHVADDVFSSKRLGDQSPERVSTLAYGITPNDDQVVLMNGPMYHSAPNSYGMLAFRHSATIVLEPRFDPEDLLRCHSACNIDPPYCRICECYPDAAVAAVDPMSADRPRQVAFPACSTRGAVGGSGPT